MNRFNKKVSKLEEKQSIRKTLQYNDEAIDYIQNNIYRLENLIKLSPDDEIIKNELDTNNYILFSLTYLDECYKNRLKQIGGVV